MQNLPIYSEDKNVAADIVRTQIREQQTSYHLFQVIEVLTYHGKYEL